MTDDGQERPAAPPDRDGNGPDGRGQTLHVTVRYAAALKPFQDDDASRDETLSALKVRILNAFGLTDGESTPDGNTLSYKMYHDKQELTDLSRTLGDIAGHAGALQLKLSQFIQQGISPSSALRLQGAAGEAR